MSGEITAAAAPSSRIVQKWMTTGDKGSSLRWWIELGAKLLVEEFILKLIHWAIELTLRRCDAAKWQLFMHFFDKVQLREAESRRPTMSAGDEREHNKTYS